MKKETVDQRFVESMFLTIPKRRWNPKNMALVALCLAIGSVLIHLFTLAVQLGWVRL